MATVGGGVTQTGSSVVNGATLTVANGGTIVNDTILAGGSAVISVGGVDNGSTISNGGYEMVLGTTSGDQIFGTQVVSAATAVVTSETVLRAARWIFTWPA